MTLRVRIESVLKFWNGTAIEYRVTLRIVSVAVGAVVLSGEGTLVVTTQDPAADVAPGMELTLQSV
jgi:hypothetical protein